MKTIKFHLVVAFILCLLIVAIFHFMLVDLSAVKLPIDCTCAFYTFGKKLSTRYWKASPTWQANLYALRHNGNGLCDYIVFNLYRRTALLLTLRISHCGNMRIDTTDIIASRPTALLMPRQRKAAQNYKRPTGDRT